MKNRFVKAIKDNDLQQVKKLIEEGMDINKPDQIKGTTLHWAAFFGHTEITEYLIKSEADVNAQGRWGTPILNATSSDIVHLLIDAGADVNATTNEDETILMMLPLENDQDSEGVPKSFLQF